MGKQMRASLAVVDAGLAKGNRETNEHKSEVVSMRVSELAKELGKSSKDVLDVLQKNNQDVATHSSNVSDAQIGMVKEGPGSRRYLRPKADGAAPKKKPAGISSAELRKRPPQPKPAARPGTERFPLRHTGSTAEQTG